MKSLIAHKLCTSFNTAKEISTKVDQGQVTAYVNTCFALSSVERNQNVLVTPAGNFSIEEYEVHTPLAGLLMPCSVRFSNDEYITKELKSELPVYSYDPNQVMTPWEFKSAGLAIAGLFRKQFVGVSVKPRIEPVVLSTVEVITDGEVVKVDNPGSLTVLPIPLNVAKELFSEAAFRDQFEHVIDRVVVNIVKDLKTKQN